MSAIDVTNACKKYASTTVLNNFHMKVERGSIYSLIGSSGCGKTTIISSLVGVQHLDSGSIKVFGEPVHKLNKLRVGYMPQETALIGGFTVREMIRFFGTLYGLKTDIVDDKVDFLRKLLELPGEGKLIRDCSGGQQRRISFALTLIHEPELLILDEPTVGVDPLLRSKIWEYLVEISSKNNVTILLSTHYIDEARQSTHVGIMRNGVLMAEDSPQNILRSCGTINLEEASLKLSEKQENGILKHNNLRSQDVSELYSESLDSLESLSVTPGKPVGNQSGATILFALLMKNLLQILRNVDMFVITTMVPLIGCICLHFGVGGRIHGLTLGIVNNEIASYEQCFNKSLVSSQVRDLDCLVQRASCRFIQEISDDIAFKKFYDNYDDAFRDASAGRIIGFILFASNFTESLTLFNDDLDYNTDNGVIQVFLDQTDLQKTTFMQKKLYDTYEKFTGSLMTSCDRAKRAGSIPIVFEASFGDMNFDMKTTLVPGFVVGAFFALASYITSISIITQKADGTWNRIIAAGAKPYHFVLSHLIEGVLISFFQFLEYAIYTIFFLSPQISLNSASLLSILLALVGLNGLVFGLLLSILAKTVLASLFFGQLFGYPTSFISGVMWPFQALPKVLQIVGYMFPFALPTAAFRNILVKNSTISESTVYLAYLNLIVWIVTQLALCFWFIRDRKGKKNK